MGFGRKRVCAAQPRMNFYRLLLFRSIPHPLRGSSLYTREPWIDANFGFVPQKKQTQNLSFQTRKRQENVGCAFSFSRLRRQLPLGGSLGSVRFSALCHRENKDKIQGSKLKVRTFFFCGSTVRRHKPSSGRKVSRASVTEGARGTERRHILLFPRRSLFPQRLPSF